ncbi:MAG: hypothetical protein ACP6IP_10680 [Candidatus Njordarchaeia archaeon]
MSDFVIKNGEIIFSKVLSKLDEFALEACRFISNFFDYVIVGGYVAILFGRSRGTEDIDIIIMEKSQKLNLSEVEKFYKTLDQEGYWVFNATNPRSGFEMLLEGLGLRIAKKRKVVPNIELKLARKPLDYESFQNKLQVHLDGGSLNVGNLELNIAFKFYLGSVKDIEDAVYLYCLFSDFLNFGKILKYARRLDIKTEILEKFLRCD